MPFFQPGHVGKHGPKKNIEGFADSTAIAKSLVVPVLTFILGLSIGAATLSGTLTGAGKLAGTSTGASTDSGTIKGAGKLTGTSTGAATDSGTLKGAGTLTGTSTGHATGQGTPTPPPARLTAYFWSEDPVPLKILIMS